MDLWAFDNDGTLYDDRHAREDFASRLALFLMGRNAEWTKEWAVAKTHELLASVPPNRAVSEALMEALNVPFDELIDEVYGQIDLDACGVPEKDRTLDMALRTIHGPKIIFTNNPSGWARRVVERLGVLTHMREIIGIEQVGFRGKPQPESFQVVEQQYPDASRYILCDDAWRNVQAARARGWITIWYCPGDQTTDTEKEGHLLLRSFRDLPALSRQL